ncbi:hypothetical protein ASPTUDRAFT_46938 [Aspergillus tubingensis CBS 134.48]|uniref:Uncharacterized protein n=1 Tax=Aspergillus tubingensis (strain CBS 134.48) TaxID=767770 RepID=A0A1L9MWW7_ASPTC|nr:hypothetical protein ASPTUDRAFT_46938 [Aspergillus tubingensis CBS 134.48]
MSASILNLKRNGQWILGSSNPSSAADQPTTIDRCVTIPIGKGKSKKGRMIAIDLAVGHISFPALPLCRLVVSVYCSFADW